MKKICAVLAFMLLVVFTCSAWADESNLLESFAQNEYIYHAINLPVFSTEPTSAPSDAELTQMLDFAMTAASAHTLTPAHFVVIRDLEEQTNILDGLKAFGINNPASEGTVLVLVFADTIRDQEHHAAKYNDWYSQMYYGIYDAGAAAGYFILAAQTMGYGVHTIAGLNIPLEDTGEVSVLTTGGNFSLVTGNYWDASKYLSSKDGTVDFTHTTAIASMMTGSQDIVAKGNLTLLAAVLVGKPVEGLDAVSSATMGYPADMANYNFWDPQDGMTYGNHVSTGEEIVSAETGGIDLSMIPDGTYTGTADDLHGQITVHVTITDGKVSAIEVDEESRTIMISSEEQLSSFFSSIIETQSMEVDGISGATVETTALRTAIGLAIASALGMGQ